MNHFIQHPMVMKRITLSILLISLLFGSGLNAQKGDLVLSYEAIGETTNASVPLESVSIENHSQNCDTTLYGEEPYLFLSWPSAINEHSLFLKEGIMLKQNVPNPFTTRTEFNLLIRENKDVIIQLYDIYGQVISDLKNTLSRGEHTFEVCTSRPGVYLLRATCNNITKSIKLISQIEGAGKNGISYLTVNTLQEFKFLAPDGNFSFQPGDQLIMKATAEGYFDETIFDNPMEDTNYVFNMQPAIPPALTTSDITDITQTSATSGGNVTDDGGSEVTARGVCWSTTENPTIEDDHTEDGSGVGVFTSNLTGLSGQTTYYLRAYATNEVGTEYGNQISFTTLGPCQGIMQVEYGNQTYNTVEIGDQCWLKENLNIGEMIPGDDEMQNNSTIEKYCYDDDPANCDEYGGLYQWAEMMQYTTQQGIQGICPNGWHIPTDNEWKILEGTVDSQYPVGDPEWDNTGWRGLDAGENLKSTSGWNNNGNGTDLYGFSALPGGARDTSGSFFGQGGSGYWWSSDEASSSVAWLRLLYCYSDQSYRSNFSKENGFSVRCLRD